MLKFKELIEQILKSPMAILFSLSEEVYSQILDFFALYLKHYCC